MEECLDYRQLTIKECENSLEEKAISVIVLSLDCSIVLELDDISVEINKIISETPIDGYEIEDRRKTFQSGAGGAYQEIVFLIALSIAGNLSTDIVKKIFASVKNKLLPKQRANEPKNDIEIVKDIINEHFSPNLPLETKKIEKTETEIAITITDQESTYFAIIPHEENIIKVKKIN